MIVRTNALTFSQLPIAEKLVERSGIKKEMRVREFYEKPSEIKRRARLRAERRTRRERFLATH